MRGSKCSWSNDPNNYIHALQHASKSYSVTQVFVQISHKCHVETTVFNIKSALSRQCEPRYHRVVTGLRGSGGRGEGSLGSEVYVLETCRRNMTEADVHISQKCGRNMTKVEVYISQKCSRNMTKVDTTYHRSVAGT